MGPRFIHKDNNNTSHVLPTRCSLVQSSFCGYSAYLRQRLGMEQLSECILHYLG